MKTRRRFSAGFKAKVALEAIRGELTMLELATKHQLESGGAKFGNGRGGVVPLRAA